MTCVPNGTQVQEKQTKKANENQGTRNDLCCERKTSKEKRAARTEKCVNSQLADLADVSTAKIFRYKEILEHGTPEELRGWSFVLV